MRLTCQIDADCTYECGGFEHEQEVINENFLIIQGVRYRFTQAIAGSLITAPISSRCAIPSYQNSRQSDLFYSSIVSKASMATQLFFYDPSGHGR
jgi:hypothetical protein